MFLKSGHLRRHQQQAAACGRARRWAAEQRVAEQRVAEPERAAERMAQDAEMPTVDVAGAAQHAARMVSFVPEIR